MKVQRISSIGFALALLANASAQTVPADDVAQAIDRLKRAALDKIDSEVEINARSFADAWNIQKSLVWSDWFRPFLDIALAVLDGLKTVGGIPGSPYKDPNAVRGWVRTSLQAANTGKSVFSFFGSFDRFRQDGANLALAIDGPAYRATVSAMLDQADQISDCWFCDSATQYRLYHDSVLNSLYGYNSQSNPLRVCHKSTTLDRNGGDVFNSIAAARSYISSQLTSLSTQMRQTQMRPDRIAEMVTFINARRQDLLQSRVGARHVTYDAYLTDGSRLLKRRVSYSLGTLTQLEQWRKTVVDTFIQSAGADTIGIIGRIVEQAGDFVLSDALDDYTETVNLKLNVQAVIAGQARANEVLKEATSLGISFAMPDIGSLADQAQSYVSNSREQINMIPQQMMDCLPGELSKTLLLIDDTVKYATVSASTVAISSVSPRTLPGLPLPQRQRITIVGSGFTSGSTLTFNDGSKTYSGCTPTFISSTELKYDIAVGPVAAKWTVKVVNGPIESDPYTFFVTSAVDTTPPPAPIGLTSSPASWGRDNLFWLSWTEPADPSGIARVWFKRGAPPSSSTDGVSLVLPDFNPFPMSLTVAEGLRCSPFLGPL
jgi:hypothetical protein